MDVLPPEDIELNIDLAEGQELTLEDIAAAIKAQTGEDIDLADIEIAMTDENGAEISFSTAVEHESASADTLAGKTESTIKSVLEAESVEPRPETESESEPSFTPTTQLGKLSPEDASYILDGLEYGKAKALLLLMGVEEKKAVRILMEYRR